MFDPDTHKSERFKLIASTDSEDDFDDYLESIRPPSSSTRISRGTITITVTDRDDDLQHYSQSSRSPSPDTQISNDITAITLDDSEDDFINYLQSIKHIDPVTQQDEVFIIVPDEEMDGHKTEEVEENIEGSEHLYHRAMKKRNSDEYKLNHTPTEFLRDNSTTLFNYYLGIHTSDGLNSNSSNFIGIAFKSSECIFLFRFLQHVGVAKPKLYFGKKETLSKTYGAGFYGSVTWGFTDAVFRNAIWDLGFPSSQIKDSIPHKIIEHFNTGGEEKLIDFLLGFFLGDGTICYSYVGSTRMDLQVRFRGIKIVARDDFILKFLKRKLDNLGCSCTLRKEYQVIYAKGYINSLFVCQSPTLVQLLLDGIHRLDDLELPVDGKLCLLRTYLTSYPNGIEPGNLPTRSRSFFEFMGSRLNDPVACVVGQDLYDENLCTVNEINTALNLPELLSIEELDINVIIKALKTLTGRDTLSAEEEVLKNYFINCSRRLPSQPSPMKDHKYQGGLVFCYECPIPRPFAGDFYLKHHIQSFHDKIAYHCEEPDCGESFKTRVTLNKHHRQNHQKNETVVYCQDCRYRSLSLEEHERHQKKMHKETNEYKCDIEGCNKTFSRRDNYEVHFKRDHSDGNREIFFCLAECNAVYLSEEKRDIHVGMEHPEFIVKCKFLCGDEFEHQAKLDKHNEKFHKKSNKHVCPVCERRFVSRDSMGKHLKRDICLKKRRVVKRKKE